MLAKKPQDASVELHKCKLGHFIAHTKFGIVIL